MKKLKFILFLSILTNFVFSQAPKIQWQKVIGGGSDERINAIKRTSDNGYILCGDSGSKDGEFTSNKGGDDCIVIKIDSLGNVLWKKNYGGSNNESAKNIFETKDHEFVVCAYTSSVDGDVKSNHGNVDYWFFKINSTGVIIFSETYGGKITDPTSNLENYDYPNSIIQTKDGGFVIIGTSNSLDGDVKMNKGVFDYWVLKIDSIGKIVWSKVFGGDDVDVGVSLIETNNNAIICMGVSRSKNGDVSKPINGDDIWVFKLDENGTLLWEKSFGGYNAENINDAINSLNGNLVLIGSSSSSDHDVSKNKGYADVWIFEINTDGKLIWEKSYGGVNDDYGKNIIQNPDSTFSIVAITNSKISGDVQGNHSEYEDGWLLKVDKKGGLIYQKCFGGKNYDGFNGIASSFDGGIVVAGYSTSNDFDVEKNYGNRDMWIVKLNPCSINELKIIAPDTVCSGINFRMSVSGLTNSMSFHWEPKEYFENPDAPNPIVKIDKATDFVVEVFNTECDDLEISKSIQVKPGAHAKFSYWRDGSDVRFLADSSNQIFSYEWDFGDRSEVLTDREVSHKYIQMGEVSVRLIVENNCNRDTFNYVLIVDGGKDSLVLGVGRKNLSTQEKNIFSPNPSTGKFDFNLSTQKNENYLLEIVNVEGKIIQKMYVDKTTKDIDLSAFPDGIYFYQMRSLSGQMFHGKLLKMD